VEEHISEECKLKNCDSCMKISPLPLFLHLIWHKLSISFVFVWRLENFESAMWLWGDWERIHEEITDPC